MKEFKITLDQTEISFLKTSLEVILNRQLNSIAEKNLYLIKNQEKLKKLKEKIELGKKSFFSNNKNEFNELKEKQREVYHSLIDNKNVNTCARKIYLSILDEKYRENPRQIEIIKDLKRHIFENDRDMPLKDFSEGWDETFF